MADFTTLAKVKQRLRIDSVNTEDDSILTSLISSATLFIQSYLSREISENTYTEKFSGYGNPFHLVSNYPIQSIDSISIDGVSFTDYDFDDIQVVLNGGVFPRGRINCTMVYTAGYTDIPLDIEQACIELVQIKYKQLEHIDLASKAIAGETTSFIVSDIPAFIKATLNLYKKVGPY